MSVESIAPVLFESVSAVTATPSVELGTERVVAGEKYIYVHNCGTGSTGVGVGLIRPASAFAGLYSCSVSSASGDMVVGFVKHATIPTLNYGWALTDGAVTVAISSSASSLAAGPVGVGANGAVATHTIGYAVGQITTAIVSGNSGLLRVKIG